MIYDQIEEVGKEKLRHLRDSIATVEAAIETQEQAIKAEDSKRREAEMKGELSKMRIRRRDLLNEISQEEETIFKKLLAEEYGVVDHPKFGKAYQIAYEHGHSSGWSEIENFFMDIVELLK